MAVVTIVDRMTSPSTHALARQEVESSAAETKNSGRHRNKNVAILIHSFLVIKAEKTDQQWGLAMDDMDHAARPELDMDWIHPWIE